MSQPVIPVSVSEVDVANAASPADGTFAVTSSPNANENRTYDTNFFTDTVQLNRVLKKRYATFTPTSRHVTNVADLRAEAGL